MTKLSGTNYIGGGSIPVRSNKAAAVPTAGVEFGVAPRHFLRSRRWRHGGKGFRVAILQATGFVLR